MQSRSGEGECGGRTGSVAERHAFKLVEKATPVVGQHLRVLDAFLGPVLVPAGDVKLGGLEVDELVADALLDEYGAVVLVDDGFLVLQLVSAGVEKTGEP